MELADKQAPERHLDSKELVDVVVRFAGDSGDGMQLTGSNFTQATRCTAMIFPLFPIFRLKSEHQLAQPSGFPPSRFTSVLKTLLRPEMNSTCWWL